MIILVLDRFRLPAVELHTSSTWYSFDVPEGWTEAGLTDAMTGAALCDSIIYSTLCADVTVLIFMSCLK